MTDEVVRGRIVRLQSGFYIVQTENGTFTCRLRGRLKHRRNRNVDVIALGDIVEISPAGINPGTIEAIIPRSRSLVRTAPTARGPYQQVLLANVDQILLVFSCSQPKPRLRMLDRFLVISEKQGIHPLIVANKTDLVGTETARALFHDYPALGYEVLTTSAKNGQGIDLLRERIKGKTSGMVGPSGTGKTSLLNAIQPGLGQTVRSISSATTKGRHTTVVRTLFLLDIGGYLADLPGLRSLSLWDTNAEELDAYFPELRERVANCQFNDCTHQDEPGCAIRAAVDAGEISPARYESYLRLRSGEIN